MMCFTTYVNAKSHYYLTNYNLEIHYSISKGISMIFLNDKKRLIPQYLDSLSMNYFARSIFYLRNVFVFPVKKLAEE